MHPDAEKLLAEYPTSTWWRPLSPTATAQRGANGCLSKNLSVVINRGIKLPKSAIAQDAWGRDVPSIALDNGDIDGWCQAIPGSLKPVLGSHGVDQAQVVLTMFKDNGSPLLSDPRQVLAHVTQALEAKGLLSSSRD